MNQKFQSTSKAKKFIPIKFTILEIRRVCVSTTVCMIVFVYYTIHYTAHMTWISERKKLLQRTEQCSSNCGQRTYVISVKEKRRTGRQKRRDKLQTYEVMSLTV